MTFLINLPIVLSRTISQKALRKSYNFLLSLEIMINVKTLKCDGQWPNFIHALALAISFLRNVMSLTHLLRFLHDDLSSPGVDRLLHLEMALTNSFSEKGLQFVTSLLKTSSSKSKLIWQFWAALKDMWRACHKSSSLMYGWLLYWIALMARSFHFLIQFISFYGSQFLLAISWIFKLKKLHFILLTVLLNHFQSSILLECL